VAQPIRPWCIFDGGVLFKILGTIFLQGTIIDADSAFEPPPYYIRLLSRFRIKYIFIVFVLASMSLSPIGRAISEGGKRLYEMALWHKRDTEPPAAKYENTVPTDKPKGLASPRTIQSLSQNERDLLSRELYALKPEIPVIFLTESGVSPSSHDRSVFISIFMKAGIEPKTTYQALEGPDQSGLLLCIPDVRVVPEKV
jgi:hypothetical protein